MSTAEQPWYAKRLHNLHYAVDELLECESHISNVETMTKLGDNLRLIGKDSLPITTTLGTHPMNSDRLRTVFHLLEKFGRTQEGRKSPQFDSNIELLSLLEACTKRNENAVEGIAAIEQKFLDLFADSVTPDNSLKTLEMWTLSDGNSCDLVPTVQQILQKTAQMKNHTELSACLLRIENARESRLDFPESSKNVVDSEEVQNNYECIWKSMVHGNLPVSK